MLVTHPPPEKDASGQEGEERESLPMEPAGAAGLEDLRRRLAAASDSTERRSIVSTIQERFGNAAAEATARDARSRREPSAGDQGEE